jgi:HSP20 family protein
MAVIHQNLSKKGKVMNHYIIPETWRESLSELKEDIAHSVNHWLSGLKPEERRSAEKELDLAHWSQPFDFALSQPKVNLEDDGDTIIVTAEIPGLHKEDLHVDLDGRQLTISGEKEESVENKKGRCYVSELRYGSFTRMLNLPCQVNRDKVKAKYRRGVLRLSLPKSEDARLRRIEVEYEE